MMDVQTAFHNADVEEEVFVKMLPGFECSNKAGVTLVMQLKKKVSADSIKAPRTCLVRLISAFVTLGFARSNLTHACTITGTRSVS